VVVDDEPLAREGMVELLAGFPEVTAVGAFGDAISALTGLETLRPDVLFVDIQMPGMSGLELVEALDLDPLPSVVFVTAHDAYAIRAFELHVFDYLLKPVSIERLAQTLERLRHSTRGTHDRDFRTRLAAMLEAMTPGRSRGVGRLIVREVGQIVVVATRDVDWVEGADYYAKVHVGQKVHLLRESLGSLEERLDPQRFMRVHRSAIVNLGRVRAVEAQERGAGLIILGTGARLKVTVDRREELERRLTEFHDAS
jgi:two-component system LytT family response regulator